MQGNEEKTCNKKKHHEFIVSAKDDTHLQLIM